MTLSASTLKSELETIASAHPANETAAITAWGDALAVYWAEATANGIPITGATVALGVTAAKTALVGMSVDGAGFGKLQAAAVAGWAAMSIPGAFGASISSIPPTGITGLAAVIAAVGVTNVADEKSTPDACQALADAWKPLTATGGTATFPGPAVFPIV